MESKMKRKMVALLVLSGTCLALGLNCIPNLGGLFRGINLGGLLGL
jgi:hypothetical protein